MRLTSTIKNQKVSFMEPGKELMVSTKHRTGLAKIVNPKGVVWTMSSFVPLKICTPDGVCPILVQTEFKVESLNCSETAL